MLFLNKCISPILANALEGKAFTIHASPSHQNQPRFLNTNNIITGMTSIRATAV